MENKTVICMSFVKDGDKVVTTMEPVDISDIKKIIQYDYSVMSENLPDDIKTEEDEKLVTRVSKAMKTQTDKYFSTRVTDFSSDGTFCEVTLEDANKYNNKVFCILKDYVSENNLEYLYGVENI